MQALVQTQKMDQLKQEVHELHEEVTTLQAEVEKLTNLVSSLTVQQKPQPKCIQPPQQQHQPLCIQLPRQQVPQQLNLQNQTPRTKSNLIPIKYAELLPTLSKRIWVQTKASPPIPKKLLARFKADLSCVFHQGAPDHDVENCYALKNDVQNLVQANILSFEDFELRHAS